MVLKLSAAHFLLPLMLVATGTTPTSLLHTICPQVERHKRSADAAHEALAAHEAALEEREKEESKALSSRCVGAALCGKADGIKAGQSGCKETKQHISPHTAFPVRLGGGVHVQFTSTAVASTAGSGSQLWFVGAQAICMRGLLLGLLQEAG